MQVTLEGFVTDVHAGLQLSISAEAERDVILRIAGVTQQTTVTAPAITTAISRTVLGRTVTTREIDELPVAARDFTNLALLTPGILGNY